MFKRGQILVLWLCAMLVMFSDVIMYGRRTPEL